MAEHHWNFFRAGGFTQVSVDTASDLRALADLDQKLWVALACPVEGTEIDAESLTLIDSDDDGRVRAPELLSSIKWMDGVLKDLGELTQRRDGLPIASLNTESKDGARIGTTLKSFLIDLEDDSEIVTVANAAKAATAFAARPFNGDGIVPPESAENDEDKAVVEEVIKTVGSVEDKAGKAGIDQKLLLSFFDDASAHLAWWAAGEETADETFPLGAETESAEAALSAVEAKIDDYFARVGLAAFDDRSSAFLVGSTDNYKTMAEGLISLGDDTMSRFPLAQIVSGQPLPLSDGINPAWAAKTATFAAKVVTPVLGEQRELTASQWAEVRTQFSGYRKWKSDMKGVAVAGLGRERLQTLIDSEHKTSLEILIARDEAVADEAGAIDAAVKAVRLYRDLHQVVNNFVSFRDFYGRNTKGSFQAGTLYLDARSCLLCVAVSDPNAHATLAGASFAHLAYCEITRRSTGQTKKIVAAFTNGDSDFLVVGRNGVFYDRQGNDWDAKIVKVVANPISLKQAFWAPYKKIAQLISDQIERFASSRQTAMEANATTTVGSGATAVGSPTPAAASPPAAFDVAKFAGIFAAVGLALGFIASAFAAILTGFLSLRVWQMPLALLGVILLISTPSLILAWLKLRQRNLAPILDASGWAINARARINVKFGAALTQLSELPEGSSVSLSDPYPDKKSRIGFYIAAVVIVSAFALAWDMGLVQKWLGVSDEDAPAALDGSGAEGPAPADGSAG
jgi:hypothetical protein